MLLSFIFQNTNTAIKVLDIPTVMFPYLYNILICLDKYSITIIFLLVRIFYQLSKQQNNWEYKIPWRPQKIEGAHVLEKPIQWIQLVYCTYWISVVNMITEHCAEIRSCVQTKQNIMFKNVHKR